MVNSILSKNENLTRTRLNEFEHITLPRQTVSPLLLY